MSSIEKTTISCHKLSQELQNSTTTTNPQIFIRYGKLITARRYLSGVGLTFLSCCLWNSFQAIFSYSWLSGKFLGFILSLMTICSGLILLILLISELLLGAGTEIEKQVEEQNNIYLEYQFTPSLNRLPLLLFFIAIAFFCILLGFSSLYAELFRQNAENFSGLQDGFLTIYFSLVTFSTVGYGDIYPVSLLPRVAAMGEIFLAMFFSLVAISTTLSWVTAHEKAKHEEFIKQRIEEIKQNHQSSVINNPKLND